MSEPSSDDRVTWWNEAYDEGNVPWDVGRPQAELVAVEQTNRIDGRILDVGCGTGVEARYLADAGYEVVGLDFSESAIEVARKRTDSEAVSFVVGDALELSTSDLGSFDTVLDCGMLHTLEGQDRAAYVGELASVLGDGGRAVCLEFGADAPEDWGPTPLSAGEMQRIFDDGWTLDVIEPVPFETQQRPVPGILGIAERTSER
ncbi:class I SAM-dependent methyltransferase [Natronomonas sp.]|uniref:class I SAM-dependent methyltransferase n=1 Tax=Natronomonas sp. TaxID=2184060 RepID=UPI002FC32D4D